MRRLEGRTVLLFGGAGGIGSAVSLRAGAEGANVVIGSRQDDHASAVAADVEANGGTALALGVDIRSETSIDAAVEDCDRRLRWHRRGARQRRRHVTRGHPERYRRRRYRPRRLRSERGNDLRGYLACTERVIPALLGRGGGAIVYTSSAAAFVGEPERPAYAITKAGLNSLVWHVASRWGKEGIRATRRLPARP